MAADHGRLERAREHCFFAGVGDIGMALCEAIAPYGVAKIHWVQEALGLSPDAMFVGAPDATVTRNVARWRQGFGYGGVWSWSGDFAVLDLKNNACGMLVGALPEAPARDELRAIAARIEKTGLELDGIALDYDLHESNHFVDVLKVKPRPGDEPPPGGAETFFIMHSSGHEHRAGSPYGPGLYWDESEALRQAARVFETPWGTLRVLEGEEARRFHHGYRQIQAFNHRRREAFAKALFGDFTVIANETHQGLVRGLGTANLGCYTYDPGSLDERGLTTGLYPLTMSATLPCYLVRGKKNFDAATLERLGFGERAERHGLSARLADVNLLPHGGGYDYPEFARVSGVIERGPDQRRFVLERKSGGQHEIEFPRELPYSYRGLEIRERLEALGLGKLVLELEPLYVL
jgi:hypothetical protein